MAQCPECQNEVGDEFGLIICTKCGSSLFIDMEGNAISGQQANAAAAEVGQFEAPQPTQYREFEFVESDEAVAEEPQEENQVSSYNVEPLEEHAVAEEVAEEHVEGLAEAEEQQDGDYAEEEPLDPPPLEAPQELSVVGEMDFSQPEADAPTPFYNAPTTADFKDVMDFANSDLSQGHDGSLKYHLTISGIDTTDLRNELKEALTDKRFIWDTEAMVRGIRDGVLEVDQVSAVKAYILVSRVAHLPLQIKWLQQPLNQP